MSNLGTEKARLIDLVELWRTRSGLPIEQVLARLQVRGCDLSRAVFENRFTTRVDQKPNVSPQLALAVIAAFTEGLPSHQRCTVKEALEFADLTRLPASRIKDLERFFPTASLYSAYRRYLPAESVQSKHADTAPRPTLPVFSTRLIGRTAQLDTIHHLLTRTRLLTLTGMGGCGKTRLAAQIGCDLRNDFANGVFFVPLASLDNPAHIASTLARAFNLKETARQPASDTIKNYLRAKQILLVLDNFEHLTAAAPCVAELLTATPELKILITSRVPLRIYGEQVFTVPPLTLPNQFALPPLAELAQCEAVALFVERAQMVNSRFALTQDNASTIAAICTRLDGLPLAIELIAAHSNLLSPQMLLQQLEQDQPSHASLLTRGTCDAPARHQTLHAAMDWSFNLLDKNEKELLARLALFAGGFTAQAVEAILGSAVQNETETIEASRPVSATTWNVLTALVDKNLIQPVAGGARFILLETIREYAMGQFERDGAADKLHHRHAAYYLALAEEVESVLRDADQQSGLARLENEHENLRAALTWALNHSEMEMALRFCQALESFWYWRGYWSEGRQWVQAALTLTQDQPSWANMRAALLDILGGFAWAQGDLEQARRLAQTSLTLFEELDDRRGQAGALNSLGLVAEDLGNLEDAIARYEASLALRRELNCPRQVILLLHNLGDAVLLAGNCVRASALAEESMTLCQKRGDQRGIAASLCQLGDIAQTQSRYDQAIDLYTESLILYQRVNHKKGVLFCLQGLAQVASAKNEPAQAARWWSAEQTVREAIGASLPSRRRNSYAQHLAELREQLGAEKFAAVWNEGRAIGQKYI